MKKKSVFILFLALAFLSPAWPQNHTTLISILFLGDSITEGYGLAKNEAYPELVRRLFKEKLGKDIKVINAGISGSTSSDGRNRLGWYLKSPPQIIFVALGVNDGLRGLNLKQTKENLKTIISRSKEKNIKVLLAGMKMPPNYGADYTKQFNELFSDLKKSENVALLPFLLEGVAGNKDLNLADGIHPNANGQMIIAKNVFEFLKGHL